MDMEAEIRELRRRVGELEGGWGFLTGQIRDVHRDLLGFQAETEERFDGIDARLDRVEKDVGVLKSDVRSLREDMPAIVGDAVREALHGRRT